MIDFGDARLPERFWDKVQVVAEASVYPGPCWIWTGGLTNGGYGVFSIRGRLHRTHRLSLGILTGTLQEDLVPDHLCLVPPCVNPAHLEAVTRQVNTLRGRSPAARMATRTHCDRGHEFTPENTGLSHGYRRCLTCHRERERRRP